MSEKFDRLMRRYKGGRRLPELHEVEWLLWRADNFANHITRGLWSKISREGYGASENQTSQQLGWTLPCREAVGLIRRYSNTSEGLGKIIDVGAGRGLWAMVLRRVFGDDTVIALDPESIGEDVLKTTFEEWRKATGGPEAHDTILTSWLPCERQAGEDLGPQILDSLHPGQTLIYIGTGPNGPVGTKEFYRRLAIEFEEYAGEPLPRIHRSVFPRDFVRAYSKRQ